MEIRYCAPPGQYLKEDFMCGCALSEEDDEDYGLDCFQIPSKEDDFAECEPDEGNRKYLMDVVEGSSIRRDTGRENIDRALLKAQILSEKKKTFGYSELSSVVGKWSTKELLFAVREPFPSKTTGTNIVFGTVSSSVPLKIESLMGENGVIFSDGIEDDFISFNSGTEVEISLADKRGKMVV